MVSREQVQPGRPTAAVNSNLLSCSGHSTWCTFGHRQLTGRCVIVMTNRQIPPAVVLCSSLRRTDSPSAFQTGAECASVYPRRWHRTRQQDSLRDSGGGDRCAPDCIGNHASKRVETTPSAGASWISSTVVRRLEVNPKASVAWMRRLSGQAALGGVR